MKWFSSGEKREAQRDSYDFLILVFAFWVNAQNPAEKKIWEEFANRFKRRHREGGGFSFTKSNFDEAAARLKDNIEELATWKHDNGQDFAKIVLELEAMLDQLFGPN